MSRVHHHEAESSTDNLKEKAKEIQHNLRELGGSAKAAAVDALESVRDTAEDYVKQGRKRAMKWEKSLEEAIEERPIRALLIAAGAGMLLGLLWRRR